MRERPAAAAGDRAVAPRHRPVLVAERDLGLGDFLTGLPALRALDRAYPRHRRLLVAPAALAPLLALARTGFALVPEPPGGADVAVNLHGRGPQSHARLLAGEPRRLLAFACGRHPGPAWRAGEHEVVRWCRLLEESGVPADPEELDLDLSVRPSGATVIHPGAASPARRWPVARWRAVAAAVAAGGTPVVVTGGPGEEGLAHAVADGIGTVRTGAGLAELAATVAAAERVVCGDTGVAHLATALRTPSVVLFGPVPPDEWGPPPQRPWHRALWAGRRGDPHGRTPDPGLLDIGPGDVLAALDEGPA